jgi:hypothetical protein
MFWNLSVEYMFIILGFGLHNTMILLNGSELMLESIAK